jgi:thioesterase domain-containing protein
VPPGLSAKDLPGGRTQALNVCRIKQIDCHPAKYDESSSPDRISDTQNWLNWNRDLDIPIDSVDHWEADNESYIELDIGRKD